MCHRLQLLLVFNSVCSVTFAEHPGKGLDNFTIRALFLQWIRVLTLTFSFFCSNVRDLIQDLILVIVWNRVLTELRERLSRAYIQNRRVVWQSFTCLCVTPRGELECGNGPEEAAVVGLGDPISSALVQISIKVSS